MESFAATQQLCDKKAVTRATAAKVLFDDDDDESVEEP